MAGGRLPISLGLGNIFGGPGVLPVPGVPAPAPGLLRPPLPVPRFPGPLPGPPPVIPPDPFEKSRIKGNEATLVFNPDRSAKVYRCERIVFAQTCQIIVDGVVVMPGTFFSPDWKYRDAWTLPSGVFLDLTEEEPGPFYPYVIGGYRNDHSSDPATMGDAPHIERDLIFFDPGRAPKGAKVVVFRLETFAACTRGPDIGRWYEGVRWDWTKTAGEQLSGKAGTAVLRDRNVAAPSQEFLAAFARYKQVVATGR